MVGVVVIQLCKTIKCVLLHTVVTLGNVQKIIDGFTDMGIPICGGAIDRMHGLILSHHQLSSAYINKNEYFSIVKQVLVDHINVEWSGKVPNDHIFRNMRLFGNMHLGTFFPDQQMHISGVAMPVVLLRNPDYPLLPCTMKSHTGHLDSSKGRLNCHLSKFRLTVEYVFVRFNGQWRCLMMTRVDFSELDMPVVAVCCVLHNICGTKGDV